MSYTYEYPRPALTVDCVVFGLDQGNLKVLLIQRDLEPYRNKWALPGGFVDMNEGLESGALRELQEETGVEDIFLEQLYTFGSVGRDPRGRVVTVAYYGLINLDEHILKPASDARNAAWFEFDDMPELAFDHQVIFNAALTRLKGKVSYEPIGFELLPEKFSLTQLQTLYETILEKKFDKRNFRKRIKSMKVLIELDEIQTDVAHRAARLYKFDEQKYLKLRQSGFTFEI